MLQVPIEERGHNFASSKNVHSTPKHNTHAHKEDTRGKKKKKIHMWQELLQCVSIVAGTGGHFMQINQCKMRKTSQPYLRVMPYHCHPQCL